MSGIAVIYNLDGSPASSALLEPMLSRIAHRGRDGAGKWIDGPVAMGHAMLRTTPESAGERQPMRDQASGLCLCFDGRVDNREELAAAIERAGAPLLGATDAELVMRAYQCWGADSPARILGDFSYALWDARNRRLFCARDPLGVKPFYYYHDAHVFLCASELHQVLEHPRVPLEPNEPMVGEYLSGIMVSREETLFQGVMRLAPGDALSVDHRGVAKRTYFHIDLAREIRYASDEQYAAHLNELVMKAVRCRMRSAGGVAAELSGGLDSSSVVGAAQKLLRDGAASQRPFETFSMSFSHPDSDERRYIEDVVGKWAVTANYVQPVVARLSGYAEQVQRYKEVPVYPGFEMADAMKAMIGARGFRVCLTGDGGDEWQSGSSARHADLLRRLKLGQLVRGLNADLQLAQLDRLPCSHSAASGLLRYAVWPLVPEPARRLAKVALRRNPLPRWMEAEFARRTELLERTRRRQSMPRCASFAQQEHYQILTKASQVFPLEMMERWASWFGFEARHPLYDMRIVEFALATPEEQRRRGVVEKFAFRNAMRDVLPESVLNRRDKADFTHIFISTFENLGGEKLFDSLAIGSLGWVKPAEVRAAFFEMMSLYRSGDLRYAAHAWPLFAVFGTELWYNLVFLERRVGAPIAAALPA